jgi:hypothetical protein
MFVSLLKLHKLGPIGTPLFGELYAPGYFARKDHLQNWNA